MTQINYVGMDVAKATLQVHVQGHQIEFQNDSQGHALLSRKLSKLPLPHVVCEATGGYERPVVQALHDQKIPVSVLNPAHTLAASRAQGKRAKSDRSDAQALTDYGQRFQPEPTPASSPQQRELTALTLWLKQLIENRALAKTQAEHQDDPFVQDQRQKLLAHYDEQIQAAEKKIQQRVQALPQFELRLDCLTEIQGVGFRTALMMLVFMPELGAMNRGQTASLAGLAPWTRDSGTMKGQRSIGGGRAQVRSALYMSALAATRCNPILKATYQSLKQRNKPSKVALTAVMRKLVIYMNHKLKALAAKNSSSETKTDPETKKVVAI
jgi:transposase